MAKTIKITKKQLREAVTSMMANYMNNMGDSKLTPEAHLFFYRGIPPQLMLTGIREIIENLESNGIKLPNDKEMIIKEVIEAIHKLIRTQL